jgi:hypothetical protein
LLGTHEEMFVDTKSEELKIHMHYDYYDYHHDDRPSPVILLAVE